MKKEAVAYWDSVAASSEADARDAILAGFRSKGDFDESGRVDADHLVLPFLARDDTVLDLGCGIGRFLKWTAPACREGDRCRCFVSNAQARPRVPRRLQEHTLSQTSTIASDPRTRPIGRLFALLPRFRAHRSRGQPKAPARD